MKGRAGAKKSGAGAATAGPLPVVFPRRSWSGTVGPEGAARADVWIAEVAGLLSRSQIKARSATITVGGREAKPSRALKPGEEVRVEWTEEPSPGLVPEDLPLSVLHEDNRCIVVDKAQGMVTHPGHGNRRGTLANALLGRLLGGRPGPEPGEAAALPALRAPDSFRVPDSFRAGIVHRLDKDTSGVMIAAKDVETQAFLAAQFKDRLARKEYLALTCGLPRPPSGRISDRLGRDTRDRRRFAAVADGGKAAVTDYRTLAAWSGGGESWALVSLRPRTGRTHQLRVHVASLGAPILGDPIYGRRDRTFPDATLMLHAWRLRIELPGGGPALFRAPLPARFRELLAELGRRFGKGRIL